MKIHPSGSVTRILHRYSRRPSPGGTGNEGWRSFTITIISMSSQSYDDPLLSFLDPRIRPPFLNLPFHRIWTRLHQSLSVVVFSQYRSSYHSLLLKEFVKGTCTSSHNTPVNILHNTIPELGINKPILINPCFFFLLE